MESLNNFFSAWLHFNVKKLFFNLFLNNNELDILAGPQGFYFCALCSFKFQALRSGTFMFEVYLLSFLCTEYHLLKTIYWDALGF